jgi:WS/DGAT/MGAT family acyltransferase
MDRLTAMDASFLAQEGPNAHMHIGAVTFFDGPPPGYDELCDHLRSRLHLVPRYRQKLAEMPFEAGRPVWIDDPSFNLEYHARHTALPAPGSEQQLVELTARIFSQRLDRHKPLWEMWLVEGVEGGRFALITKTHHALVDGIGGVDILQVVFDLDPVPRRLEVDGEPWEAAPPPSSAQLLAEGAVDVARRGLALAGRALGAALRPQAAVGVARDAAQGVGEVAWAALNPAPETPFNVEIGPHRRLAWRRFALDDLREVKRAFGSTVNDVLLTVVAGALGDFLRSRGVRTEGLELRALVPVSIRTQDQHGHAGNRLAAMRGPLPVYARDPVVRLRLVKQAMDGLKESKQAVGAEVLARVQSFAPPTILAQASRINFSTRLFNLLVTNVPGPQIPLYVLGRELQDIIPVAFLPEHHALAVAIISYNGRVELGLLADYDAIPDLETIADACERQLALLVEAARGRSRGPDRHRRRAGAAARSRPQDPGEPVPGRAGEMR